MIKKLCLLVAILAPFNGVFSQEASKEETYDTIKVLYLKNPQTFYDELQPFFEQNQLSIEQLLEIVQYKIDIIMQQYYSIKNSMFTSPVLKPTAFGPIGDAFNFLSTGISAGLLALSGTSLTLGYVLNQKIPNPSIPQQLASYGFMGLGSLALISEIVMEAGDIGIIKKFTLGIYERIVNRTKKQQLKDNEAELNLALKIKDELKKINANTKNEIS